MRNVVFAAIAVVAIALVSPSSGSAAPANGGVINNLASTTKMAEPAYCRWRYRWWCRWGRCHYRYWRWCW
jgi:hypothetical protein